MHLSILAIRQSKSAVVPNGIPFGWTCHHVAEVFLALLPKRFVLDGSGLVQITCGPRDDEPKYQQMLGSTEVFSERFDFVSYYEQTPCERQEVILHLIEDSFIEIMSYGVPPADARSVLRDTVAAVREHNFALSIPSRKLSRSTSSRKVRGNVFRNLSHELGEVWSIRFVAKNKQILHEAWIGTKPHYLDMGAVYARSRWNGTVFEILGRTGKVYYEFDVAPFLS